MADEKEKKVTEKKETEKKSTKPETKSSKVAETKTANKTAETKTTTKKATTEKKVETAKKEVAEKKEKTAVKEETKNKAKTVTKKSVKESEGSEELIARAEAKYVRISSRKVAIVANLIRGKKVDEALAILEYTPKAGTEVLTKLLKSAIANAENNNGMDYNKLYIAEIYSNQGPTLKRIRPAAKGSAVRIRKRTSNTTIILKEKN